MCESSTLSKSALFTNHKLLIEMKLFVVLGLAKAQSDCTDVFYDGKTLRGFFLPEQRNIAGEVVDYGH